MSQYPTYGATVLAYLNAGLIVAVVLCAVYAVVGRGRS